MSNISIQQFISNFNAGMYDSDDYQTQCDAGWYDWFCKQSSLRNKTIHLTKKLKQLCLSEKIDMNKHYVFFKNNCGNVLYDDFRICCLETGDVQYTVSPNDHGRATVWGKDNNFDEPLVEGNWKDVKAFFNV